MQEMKTPDINIFYLNNIIYRLECLCIFNMALEKRREKYASVKKPVLSWSDLDIAIISKPCIVALYKCLG
jgi:hypothetical protein